MKKSQRGFAGVLIIIIIAVLAIGGGVYIYTNNKVEAPTDVLNVVNNVATTTGVSDKSSFKNQDEQNAARERARLNSEIIVSEKPLIKVIYPNGGETLNEGDTVQIKWSTKDIKKTLDIKLVDNNNSVVKTIASNINAIENNSYNWTVPNAFVSEASPLPFKILISSSDNTISDYSDSSFRIAAGRQPVPKQ